MTLPSSWPKGALDPLCQKYHALALGKLQDSTTLYSWKPLPETHVLHTMFSAGFELHEHKLTNTTQAHFRISGNLHDFCLDQVWAFFQLQQQNERVYVDLQRRLSPQTFVSGAIRHSDVLSRDDGTVECLTLKSKSVNKLLQHQEPQPISTIEFVEYTTRLRLPIPKSGAMEDIVIVVYESFDDFGNQNNQEHTTGRLEPSAMIFKSNPHTPELIEFIATFCSSMPSDRPFANLNTLREHWCLNWLSSVQTLERVISTSFFGTRFVHYRSPHHYHEPWIEDNHGNACTSCGRVFRPLWRLRHHCRVCREGRCDDCTVKVRLASSSKKDTKVRICTLCCATRNQQRRSSSASASSRMFETSAPTLRLRRRSYELSPELQLRDIATLALTQMQAHVALVLSSRFQLKVSLLLASPSQEEQEDVLLLWFLQRVRETGKMLLSLNVRQDPVLPHSVKNALPANIRCLLAVPIYPVEKSTSRDCIGCFCLLNTQASFMREDAFQKMQQFVHLLTVPFILHQNESKHEGEREEDRVDVRASEVLL